MTSMSGWVVPSAPKGSRSVGDPSAEGELFQSLVITKPQRARSRFGFEASLVAHVLSVALVVLVPIYWSAAPPEHPDYLVGLIYNPPPPPPPPLPKGSALKEKVQPAKPVTPEVKPEKPTLSVDIPKEEPLKPEARPPDTEQAGSPNGSDSGVAEGSEFGKEGGVVGGVPGGVLGGVIGGTGDGPVSDYDQPPRPILQTKPQYPQDAFIKKIEGTVILEILIDISGRVARARVIQSIPPLDEAARQTVLQWRFSPALKRGRPVAIVANAPVTFRIF